MNAEKKQHYNSKIVGALLRYNKKAIPLNGNLYGFAYYFHKLRTELDADNFSKPIWDALNETAYSDDRQIVFRSSGMFDLRSTGIDVLDLTNWSENILDDFLIMIDDDKMSHILYVEVGKFEFELFQFGYEK